MIRLAEKFDEINEYFSPKVVGEVNNVFVKIVKCKGEDIPWHTHENEDELFYVLEGSLLMEVRGQESFKLSAGEMFVVKKGIEHRISAKEECKLMVIENKTTEHTGKVKTDITKNIEDQMK